MTSVLRAALVALALAACATSEELAQSAGGGAGGAGGSSGAAGQAGAGGDAGPADADAADAPPGACQCGDVGCGSCPAGAVVAAGGFTIDALEVTNEAYAAWLALAPEPALQPSVCGWNASFVPSGGWPVAAADAKRPVVWVDHCDAAAYCRWARRRLCGRVGGGANAFGDFADPAKSQWQKACSGAGAKPYPYGAQYQPTACNGADLGAGATLVAGSASGCIGGYPGLFDMSGNVWEWEDACQGSAGAADLCRIRGGSFAQGEAALTCGAESALARNAAGESVGFRCCE